MSSKPSSLDAEPIPQSKAITRAGWALSGLSILFLLFDAITKLGLERHVIAATTQLEFPLGAIQPIGLVLLVCTILYIIPRTAVLGAILLTGFLGGAVASKVRIMDPLFASTLFPVYFGLFVWGGLYLRNARLRALLSLRRQ